MSSSLHQSKFARQNSNHVHFEQLRTSAVLENNNAIIVHLIFQQQETVRQDFYDKKMFHKDWIPRQQIEIKLCVQTNQQLAWLRPCLNAGRPIMAPNIDRRNMIRATDAAIIVNTMNAVTYSCDHSH